MSSPASIPSRAAVVIVGGGMAGLSCSASLARRGVRDVVLLEAQTLAHAKASSYGETRMFREMYSDSVLCRLAQEANRLWREEESHAGQQLRETHGLLFYGESWDEETIEGSIPGARRVMDDQRIPYEALNADQIAARFPLKPKPGFTGLFEPTAGAVRSDRVVAHWINTARNAGHQLIEHCPVAGLDADGGGSPAASIRGGEPFNFHNFSSLQGFTFHRAIVSSMRILITESISAPIWARRGGETLLKILGPTVKPTYER